jgi:hypothetical protein
MEELDIKTLLPWISPPRYWLLDFSLSRNKSSDDSLSPKFRCFARSPLDLNPQNVNPSAGTATKVHLQIMQSNINPEDKNFGAPVSDHYF